MRYIILCHRGIATWKQKIFTIHGSKYCAKNKRNAMIAVPTRYKHRSSDANRPSDDGVTVNLNAEFNLSVI